MLFVVDVGNTDTVIGLMEGEEVLHTFRISTIPRTTDELGLLWIQLLAHRGISPKDVVGAVCSSVVPSVVFNYEKAARRYLEAELMLVGRKLRTGMKVRTDNPREVGSDRIVNSVAAIHRWGGPIIVVDFGTATTFDCVNADNEYVGGAIAPGFRISEEALVSHTAQLPRIEMSRPPSVIGKNTVHAMQAGLYFGYVGLVDALARRCRDELGGVAKVVATGGLATMLAEGSEVIEEVDPHLTLRGLSLVYERNRPSR
jgi:type III pantothenate kinase